MQKSSRKKPVMMTATDMATSMIMVIPTISHHQLN